ELAPETWIEANLAARTKLAYDPWLHTVEGAEKLAKACMTAGAALIGVDTNPLDAIWTDRPPPPQGQVVLHDLHFAGEDTAAKLERLRAEIGTLRADAIIVSDPHALAWTFNIRGADVAHTPI